MAREVNEDGYETIEVKVNGEWHREQVPVRKLLADFLREDLGLTGTHLGCEHGVCGACTVRLEGETVRSCLMFAVQVDGLELRTVEAMAPNREELHPIQQAFWEKHGLQCGFCTPGFLMTAEEFLEEEPEPDREQIRERISGNLCRCTGYKNIVTAIQEASRTMVREPRAGAQESQEGDSS